MKLFNEMLFLQNDFDKTLDKTESNKIVEDNLKTFENIVSKSVLSVQMQELLGTYLLLERFEKSYPC